MQIVSRLISAWPLVGKRSLAHWRLLSSVVFGVLLASAIMAGSVIYFDSLRELALKNTLEKLTPTEMDILVKARRGPTSYVEYERVSGTVNREVDARVGWLLRDRIRGAKTATFFLTSPGNEGSAGLDNSRAYFEFLPRLLQHITLQPGGRLPQEEALSDPSHPVAVEAIIPVEAAELFGVGVGDRLSAIPHWDDVTPYASVVISGLFERQKPEDEFWHLGETIFQSATSGDFRAVPFYISEKTFMEVLGGKFRDMDSTYGWHLVVDSGKLNAGNTSLTRANIEFMRQRLGARLFSFRQITSLDDALEEYDRRLFFSKLSMFVILILISVVILYYVVTLSSLLVERQRSEVALLRSRGATSAQILSVFVMEGATISIVAVVVAPLLASIVIGLLGFSPAFSDLSGNEMLPVTISGGAYMMSALGGVLSFVALIIPAVQASRIGVIGHRQQATRPASQPFFQRYYVDVMLLVVSVVLFRRLSEQGSVVTADLFGELAADQLLLAAPALILVASGMMLLRLFPLSIRFLSGDSPALLHLILASTVLILGPSIAIRELWSGGDPMWIAQVALLAGVGGVYWATERTRTMPPKIAGIVLQAGLVTSILFVGPDLPLKQVFVPILIGIVVAQIAFIALRATARRAPVGFSMGLWQMARNPTHYARLSLLLILMAGLGIFAASFGGTLNLSFEERALYSSGADIRLEGVTLNNRGSTRSVVESYMALPGVEEVGPVFRGFGSDMSTLFGKAYTMFAMDGEALNEIGWFRDDFSKKPMAQLLTNLDHPNPPQGIALPSGARTIGVRIKADRPHATVTVIARIKDANDRYFSYHLGALNSSDWLELETPLSKVRRIGRFAPLQPVRPLTLVSLAVHETDWRRRLSAGSVAIDEIHVRIEGGTEVVPIEVFDEPQRWTVLRVAADSSSDTLQHLDLGFDGISGAVTFIWTDGAPLVGRGIFHGPEVSPLPVLASESFLKDTGHSLGEEFEVSVAGKRVPIRLVDTVEYFPTLDTINKSFLISDLTSLVRYVNLDGTSNELKPNEVWLSAPANGTDRTQLIQTLEGDEPFANQKVNDRVAILGASLVDPLVEAGWRALLFIAFSAVLILSGVGFLVHAYVSFRGREVQFALIRTFGFSMRQMITLVWLEQALVIGAGMGLGTWMGGRMGEIIMPFLGHDDFGGQVLPPFEMQVSWGSLGIVYGATAFLFALITMGVIWFIHKISLQRILRLGEM